MCSLKIHVPKCQQKFETEQQQKTVPRPLPEAPPELDYALPTSAADIDAFNNRYASFGSKRVVCVGPQACFTFHYGMLEQRVVCLSYVDFAFCTAGCLRSTTTVPSQSAVAAVAPSIPQPMRSMSCDVPAVLLVLVLTTVPMNCQPQEPGSPPPPILPTNRVHPGVRVLYAATCAFQFSNHARKFSTKCRLISASEKAFPAHSESRVKLAPAHGKPSLVATADSKYHLLNG